jgi:hypothetical protein
LFRARIPAVLSVVTMLALVMFIYAVIGASSDSSGVPGV